MEDYRLEQTGQEVQRILNGAAMDANLQAEVERATDAEGTLQENIDAEAQARQDADGLLQQGIDDEAQRAKDAEEANAGDIEGIKALIPSTASEVNKLADTNYVNSSIQTATAEYRGDYNVVTDLHLAIDATHAQIETLLPTVIAEADKNDYCYVMIPTNASTPTEIAKIERYKMTSDGWKFEYDVNNSTFTAEEWAAIKSGITSGLVGKLNALPTNADLLLLLAGKQDLLIFDSVPVPESNNPVKSGGVYSAIDDEKTARLNSDTAIHTELDGLQAKVPATASSDNKLVDQNQMNTSISTATATYRGDWNVVSDLHLAVDATRAQIAALLPTVISTADNNDYCYVEIPTSAETPTQIERVERYKFNGTAWGYEYTLNNSGFTAAQWAAINSMITSGLVAKLSALPTNADLLAMLAQKQDVLTFDSTPTENSTNPVTSGGVFAADKALSDAIEAILLLIPSAATSLNKLVDTALMNSSISTATATFRGTYNLVSDLGLGIDATEGQIAAALSTAISTADNNDYAFVQIPTSAQTPTQIARTDRYKFNGTAWAFEYTLNTSGFTAAQWAAINSTITSALVAKLNALPTAAELQEALGVLTSGITAINQKIPSTASQSNKLVDNASMESYIAQVINILDASFNVTSTDGHITLHITQVDGVITSVQVQSSDIASAADLALKASQADLTDLASRVTTAEGNITSLTGRMGSAETNIANLQQLYNNLQQSKPVPVTALPSTGQQQGVIYRLAGTTSYSDYMWNGSSWVLMATYNNAIDPRPKKASQNLVTSGGVFDNIGAFDVSELNATENPHTLAQYADLSSALAAIPTDYQKGGMSIKFVQSSDNKYVQYRLMKDTWSTLITDWQYMGDFVEEKEHPIADNEVAGYLTDKNKSVIAKLMKSGAVEWLVKNSDITTLENIEDLLSYVSSEVPDSDNGVIKYLTDKDGNVIATINNVGDTQFYGGGGFDGETTKSRSVGFDAVKVLTGNNNAVVGWITSKGKVHIEELEVQKLEGNVTDAIPNWLQPLLNIAGGEHNSDYVNDQSYEYVDKHKAIINIDGIRKNTNPMLLIHDDDTVDNQIPTSYDSDATPETIATRSTGGYASVLLPVLMAFNAKYKDTINGKVICSLAAEGQRIGLTPLYGMQDAFEGNLNINGQIINKIVEKEGWEVMCHSMTARYLENSYLVNGLDSEFANSLLVDATYSNKNGLGWRTTTCYDTVTQKNYKVKQDLSGWDECPLHYAKPYLAVSKADNSRLVINPTYSVKYQMQTWFDRATVAGLKYLDRLGIKWGSSGSFWHMREVMKYADTMFNLNGCKTNTIPIDSVIGRILYSSTPEKNGITEHTDYYNAYNDYDYQRLCDVIDTCKANNGLTVLASHTNENASQNKYWPASYGFNYPTRTEPSAPGKLDYYDENYSSEWHVPLKYNELMDMLNNEDSTYWTTPPQRLGIQSWADFYPCPGTTLAMLWDVLVYAMENGLHFGTSTEAIKMFGNKLSIGLCKEQARYPWPADARLGSIPEENKSYCVIGADGSIRYSSKEKNY